MSGHLTSLDVANKTMQSQVVSNCAQYVLVASAITGNLNGESVIIPSGAVLRLDRDVVRSFTQDSSVDANGRWFEFSIIEPSTLEGGTVCCWDFDYRLNKLRAPNTLELTALLLDGKAR